MYTLTPEGKEIIAGVVIQRDGKYLLVQEKQPKAYKLWNFPAGHVEDDMTIEETAVMEAKEETGYDVKLIEKVQEWDRRVMQHLFSAEITGGELKIPEHEIMDAKWFTLEELKGMKEQLRGNWILEGIEKVEKG